MTTPTPRMSYLRKELARHGHTGDTAWIEFVLGGSIPPEGLNFGQVECLLHVLKTTPDVAVPS